MTHVPPSAGLLLFPFAMLAVLLVGEVLVTLVDPSIGLPQRFGVRYTLDWSKSLSWLVLAYMVGIVIVIFYGVSHPDAPGISQVIQFLSGLWGRR